MPRCRIQDRAEVLIHHVTHLLLEGLEDHLRGAALGRVVLEILHVPGRDLDHAKDVAQDFDETLHHAVLGAVGNGIAGAIAVLHVQLAHLLEDSRADEVDSTEVGGLGIEEPCYDARNVARRRDRVEQAFALEVLGAETKRVRVHFAH